METLKILKPGFDVDFRSNSHTSGDKIQVAGVGVWAVTLNHMTKESDHDLKRKDSGQLFPASFTDAQQRRNQQ